ncbi:MAG: DUF4834 family protein [Bacteroidia bacterium]|jgi:hypothetical protein|nr:DUF4834 family protein [Bacteroidia bacterium]
MSEFMLVLVIIFLLFGVFRRYIFFFVMSAISKKLFREMNRMQDRQREAFSQQQQQQQTRVNVDPEQTRQRKNFRDDQGEYVDYEEVKD